MEFVASALVKSHLLIYLTPQKTVGHFAKDKFAGKFVDEWAAYLAKEDRASKINYVDVSVPVAGLMAIKELDEIVRAESLC